MNMKSNPLKRIAPSKPMVTDLLKKSELFVGDSRFSAMVIRKGGKLNDFY